MRRCILSILSAVAVWSCASGCSRTAKSLDEAEFQIPWIKKALALQRIGDSRGAVLAYRKALDEDQRIARAHLGLAFLLDKPDGDYVLALYHYRRYLELRPMAEKREIIEKRIRATRAALVASLSSEAGYGHDLAVLKAENANLKSRIRDIESQSSVAVRQGASSSGRESASRLSSAKSAGGAGASTPPAASRAYIVQPGDTLRGIAARMYGDPERWRDIYRANRNVLSEPGDIQPGQALGVPR
jgi:tetratricopeptide (TPR) repeat protein